MDGAEAPAPRAARGPGHAPVPPPTDTAFRAATHGEHVSNPYFDRNPVFNGTATRTPAGYPTYPGYTPGAGRPAQQGTARQQGPGGYAPQQAPQDMTGFEQTYRGPDAAPADTGRMTYDDVIVKSALVLGTVVLAAAANWFLLGANPLLTFGGAIVGLVLGLVNAFKREPSPALIMAYAVAQGLFLGGISAVFGAMYEGIVLQAVVATFAVFAVSLGLFASGKVRVTGKFTRFLLIGMLGYLAFSLVNVVLMLTGVSTDPWGLRTGVEIFGIPLGLLVGVVAVFLAAMSLIMDFDSIKRGVEAGVPGRYAWAAAFGLAVTLIWLYLELLRLLAILRSE